MFSPRDQKVKLMCKCLFQVNKFENYRKRFNLRNICKVVFNVRRFQPFEPETVTYSHLDVIGGHLTLEAFLQRQNCRVHRIIQFQVFAISKEEILFIFISIAVHKRNFLFNTSINETKFVHETSKLFSQHVCTIFFVVIKVIWFKTSLDTVSFLTVRFV